MYGMIVCRVQKNACSVSEPRLRDIMVAVPALSETVGTHHTLGFECFLLICLFAFVILRSETLTLLPNFSQPPHSM